MTSQTKSNPGNYFEDFSIGRELVHATPQTVTEGDIALYRAMTGNRYAQYSSAEFAKGAGLPGLALDPIHAFHVVFGKSVPDISLNAVANLGYADGRIRRPIMPGDTLNTVSEVIGMKENSNKRTGVVWVRTRGFNQNGIEVMSFVRWVMVNKWEQDNAVPPAHVPELPDAVPGNELEGFPAMEDWDFALAGSPYGYEDYEIGEKINHVDGMTVEEAEHQIATRLYQNTAKVHFNQHTEGKGRFGKRLIYGGHVISLARALSFNGRGNAFHIAGINGGRHVAPLFSGDTVFAWSEVLDTAELEGRTDVGALRLRLVATKNRPCGDFPLQTADGKYEDGVILDFDFWALMPK